MNARQPTFLHSYLFDGRGGGRSVDTDAVNAWSADQGILWIHIDIEDASSRRWLIEHGGVDDSVADGLLAEDVRPRSHVNSDGLLVVLRGVNTNPGDDPEDMVAIRIWLEKDRIISVRRRQLLSVQDIRAALETGHGPATTSEFLSMLLERLSDRIADFVDNIELRIGDTEDEFETTRSTTIRRQLGQLRRQIASVRRFLAPQRDALDRLYRYAGPWLSEDDTEHIREEADRLTRNLEDLDLGRERAILLQEEMLNQLAQEQNARMYVLSVVAAIFLPLTFVTGLFGMNVGGLPWLEDNSGFVATLIIMVVAAGGLFAFFRWKRWI